MADDMQVLDALGNTKTLRTIEDSSGISHQTAVWELANSGEPIPVDRDNPVHVASPDELFEVVPTLDTAAYTAEDVLFAATEVAGVALGAGRAVWLSSLQVVDVSDQRQGFYLHLFDRAVTFGAANDDTPSLSDADAAFYMGTVGVFVSNYHDLGGVAVATAEFNPILLKPNATSIYIAAITQGAPTYAANGLRLKLGFVRT